MKAQDVIINSAKFQQREPTLTVARAKALRRSLGRRSIRDLNPQTKTAILAILILLLGGMVYLGIATHREFSQNRRLNDEQNRHLAGLEDQLSRTNQQVAELAQSNQAIDANISLTTKLWSSYSNGVCLISGSYVFIDQATGRPLRIPNEEQAGLTSEGDGEIAEVHYEGTGFYVGDGYNLVYQHSDPRRYRYDVLPPEALQSTCPFVSPFQCSLPSSFFKR